MIEYVRKILTGQLEAALCMMNDCIEKCPPEPWDGRIAKYPFWQVVYHTLCFVDYYLSPGDASFQPRKGPGGFHPQGLKELEQEYPSRRFDKREMIEYLAICRRKALETLAAETRESLEGASGFPRLAFSRGELHLYNIRHVQHHTGQLSAYLRRFNQDANWVKTGWR